MMRAGDSRAAVLASRVWLVDPDGRKGGNHLMKPTRTIHAGRWAVPLLAAMGGLWPSDHAGVVSTLQP